MSRRAFRELDKVCTLRLLRVPGIFSFDDILEMHEPVEEKILPQEEDGISIIRGRYVWQTQIKELSDMI